MTGADSSEEDLHRGSWAREYALWILMTAIGALGAIVTAYPLEAPDTGVQIYAAVVESQELLFWIYLVVAGLGAFLILTAEADRRFGNGG